MSNLFPWIVGGISMLVVPAIFYFLNRAQASGSDVELTYGPEEGEEE